MCNILVGKSQGRRSIGRSKQKWKDHIKIDIGEKERENP
jgi:hypothetical protein